MKKQRIALIVLAAVAALVALALVGCTEADRVSTNISNEADNFNVERKLTVMNTFSDTIMFEMTGVMSIHEDVEENQLEITVKESKDKYKKHFVKLSQFVTYVCEDTTGQNVSTSKYTLNFNPKMLVPFDVKNYNTDSSK